MFLKIRPGLVDPVRMEPPTLAIVTLLVSRAHRAHSFFNERKQLRPASGFGFRHLPEVDHKPLWALCWAGVELLAAHVREDHIPISGARSDKALHVIERRGPVR